MAHRCLQTVGGWERRRDVTPDCKLLSIFKRRNTAICTVSPENNGLYVSGCTIGRPRTDAVVQDAYVCMTSMTHMSHVCMYLTSIWYTACVQQCCGAAVLPQCLSSLESTSLVLVFYVPACSMCVLYVGVHCPAVLHVD